MATDLAPAAVPGPSDPPGTTPAPAPAGGLLASMLAPVDPARPTFDLTPTAGQADTAVTGGSSAAYHGNEAQDTAQQGSGGANGRKQQGVVRAWLLAGAARWAKGGGAQNKRLDLSKAKAQANQVKENRQVKVNRSDSPLPGKASNGSGGNGSGGKSAAARNSPAGKAAGGAKNSPNGAANGGAKGDPKGPLKSPGRTNQTPAGRSAGGPPAGNARTQGPDRSPRRGTDSPGGKTNAPAPKPSKVDLKKTPPGGSGKSTGQGPAGGSGKASAGGSDRKGLLPGSRTGGKDSKTGAKETADTKAGRKTAGPDGAKTAPGTKTPGGSKGPALTKGKADTVKPGATKPGTTTGDKADDSTKNPKPSPAETPKTRTEQVNGKPFSTRESRETGYRDGTRAAKAAAHVQAYKDGAKDGWTDTQQAAAREKDRLTKAHQARKNAQDEEQQVTGTTTSADPHKPEPITVKDVTASGVELGHGAARDSLSRGEVRTLKAFERRLGEQVTRLTQAAEDTKILKAHAEEQADKATKLAEEAKSVKGGDKLAGSLARCEEAAKAQAAKAQEIHTRAVRAAEACRVVLTNVEARYGGIYKAVVDSDETAPAELAFYQG